MRKEPSKIAPLLKSMTSSFGMEQEMLVFRLKKEWGNIVGEQIATNTQPQKIRFQTLTLLVKNPAWMHELTFLKKELLEKINRKLGKQSIKVIQLRSGQFKPATNATDSNQKKQKRVLSTEEKNIVTAALAPLKDPKLKEAVRQAMEHHLQRQQPD